MWQKYLLVSSIEETIRNLSTEPAKTYIIAGGTDIMLEIERNLHPDLHTLIDVSRIPGLNHIWKDEAGYIHIGATATHNDVLKSDLIREQAFPLMQACWQIGSPQIRNRGTVAGNLVTASPANDTITPLLAMDAGVLLVSTQGERLVKLKDFYLGVRKTVKKPTEFLKEIIFKGQSKSQKGFFIKTALREAQAISVINICVLLDMDNDFINEAVITLGAVAPTIIHAQKAEAFLKGKLLDSPVIEEAARLTSLSASPISDIRGSNKYRSYMVGVIAKQALDKLASNKWRESVPESLIRLDGNVTDAHALSTPWNSNEIVTTINGKEYRFTDGLQKNLLDLIRDHAGLTGTKEGCGEGECGACTVYLDGKAVMSCLVPAPRAHGAKITTIEGINANGEIHPVQSAFVDYDAVQCGFCTPGFVMSSVKLFDENPLPSQDEIKQALTGNLCRCTGYYKIMQAVEAAAKKMNKIGEA